MNYHGDAVARERVIAAYLVRRIAAEVAEDFEAHYLGCDDCFAELVAADLLRTGLRLRRVQRSMVGSVMVLGFPQSSALTWGSAELEELSQTNLDEGGSRVVLDLSNVSRIDSAGLGQLMRMHTHLVRNSGALRVLNPGEKVQRLLRLTRIDSVLETYADIPSAVRSFPG